ncbi:hypothetical protein QBC39DRAFT_265748, partial [Podospora conica]
RPHHAEEVYVTGTFDNWSKSEKLEKVDGVFQKTVTLPSAQDKIYYKVHSDEDGRQCHAIAGCGSIAAWCPRPGHPNPCLCLRRGWPRCDASCGLGQAPFVVDNNWVTDHTAPKERDHEGNENNVLLPKDMTKPEDEAGPGAAILSNVTPESTTAQLAGAKKEDAPDAGILSNVTPESTTAQLAGSVPLENKAEDKSDDVVSAPGGYPETPATELEKEFSVSPLPAANGAVNPIKLAPGEEVPKDITSGSVTDNVTLDKEAYEKSDRLPGDDKEFSQVFSVNPLPSMPGAVNPTPAAAEPVFSVNPLPATEGALNPITLAPGEAIPESATAGSITDNVTLDKESYEKSDRIPGLPTDLPPVTSNMIPESSLPIIGADVAAFNTVTPESTTAALAAAAPVEATVPEIVKQSQEAAHAPPEASAIPEEVQEKAIVEKELLGVVAEAPSTSEGTAGKGTDKAETDLSPTEAAIAGAGAIGAVLAGAAIVAGTNAATAASGAVASASTAVSKAAGQLPDSIKNVLPEALKPAEPAAAVPEEVKESIKAAGESPEAAANEVAVEEKKEVEAELLKEVKEVPAAAESKAPEPAAAVPAEVKESIKESGESPEAAANAVAVEEKKEVEAELLKEVKEVAPIVATPAEAAAAVPAEVKESIKESGESPEAAANAVAVEDKKEVEAELLKEVKEVAPVATKVDEPTAVVPKGEPTAPAADDDVKPEPAAAAAKTNGVAASEAPKDVAPETPAKPAETKPAASPAAAKPAVSGESTGRASDATSTGERKKRNRLSTIFSKLKHKVSGKDKDEK